MNPGLTVRMPSPALFTSMSMPPSRDHASSTARATDDSSRTSSSTPTAPGNSAATEPARRPDRPVSATDAPAAARAEAIANPNPLVPPVTNTLTGIPRPTNGPPPRSPSASNTHDHDARSSCVLEVKPRRHPMAPAPWRCSDRCSPSSRSSVDRHVQVADLVTDVRGVPVEPCPGRLLDGGTASRVQRRQLSPAVHVHLRAPRYPRDGAVIDYVPRSGRSTLNPCPPAAPHAHRRVGPPGRNPSG